MAFQRSYSKVWWGSDNQTTTTTHTTAGTSFTSGGFYNYYNNNNQYAQQQQQQQQQQQYHSLDLHSYKANLSCIQEVDDEQNISKISWQKHDSPGSLRSQDSGFSDNDESQSMRSLSGRYNPIKSNVHNSPSSKSDKSTTSATSSTSTSTDDANASPTSIRSIATPPTVVRRIGNSSFYSPLVNVTRRISFNSPNKTLTDADGDDVTGVNAATTQNSVVLVDELDENTSKLFAQFDSMQLSNGTTPKKKPPQACVANEKEAAFEAEKQPLTKCTKSPQPVARRRKRVARKQLNTSTSENTTTKEEEASVAVAADGVGDDTKNENIPAYNNETVFLIGEAPPPYNNETVVFGGVDSSQTEAMEHEQSIEEVEEAEEAVEEQNRTLTFELTPLRARFTANTSTPNARAAARCTRPLYAANSEVALSLYPEYENPLLNGHMPAVQGWLADLRMSYDQEVMSTLQTKSIAQEAFKNLTITTSSVTKLIRQLQQRALELQTDFERNERILTGRQAATLHEALLCAEQLITHIGDFTKVLERRVIFFTDSRVERRRFEEQLEQIRIVTKDTRYSLERQHYINLESLLDDLQVLKRNLLLTLRLIFERMVRILVQSIEQSRCDMLLRANINMIATLTNIDYDGFASLTDAFVQNEAVRALLVIVLDHRQTSVRALALRALATICCAPEAIAQLGACGGIEIVRDILLAANAAPRGDIERREAVSLLAQITAAWHGVEHRVDGLKDCAETIVAGLVELITPECCPQTLLLCAAALNNLSRMEATSHYSIMSNEAIFKLIAALESRDTGVTVFLDEQIVSMLHNMSLNKKCHSHLANGIIINFITSVYQTEFYKTYGSRAESEAQRRCIKAILHTLTRLVQDSNCPALGAELVEQWRLPEFFMLANANAATTESKASSSSSLDNSEFSRDISQLARQLLHAHQREQQMLLLHSTAFYRSGNQMPEAQTDSYRNDTMSTAATATAAAATPGPTSGLKFNLTRQESFV